MNNKNNMKRWDPAGMVDIGRKLFAKIHKQKRHANPNHDVHFMARELDDWLVQGVESMADGSYTPRHLKRHYFTDEMVDQLHLSDRIFQNILLKQLKPTFPYVMNSNCYHLHGPSGVRLATQRIRQVLREKNPKYIIRADIKSFYKSIPHHQLVQDIKQHYNDLKVQTMLEQIIINPIETPRGYKNPDHGIALRGPLSQFFSGIYLKPLDDTFDSMDVTYLRYQDDILILCQSLRQLNRCKQRMMDVLHERRLSLSRKKTRIGCIEKGFHFLGIHYPGTQTQDNTNVTQAIDKTVISVNIVQHSSSLNGGGQILQVITNCLRWIALSHTQGRYEKHVNRLSRWLLMGCLPKGSEVTCIAGPCGG
jgi:retron-type reverse transcriptase